MLAPALRLLTGASCHTVRSLSVRSWTSGHFRSDLLGRGVWVPRRGLVSQTPDEMHRESTPAAAPPCKLWSAEACDSNSISQFQKRDVQRKQPLLPSSEVPHLHGRTACEAWIEQGVKVSIVITRCCAQYQEKLTISATMKIEV